MTTLILYKAYRTQPWKVLTDGAASVKSTDDLKRYVVGSWGDKPGIYAWVQLPIENITKALQRMEFEEVSKP